MTIQPIGADRVVLSLTAADLSVHGLSPTALTVEQALILTRAACAREGITLDGTVEIEIYPGQQGVMLFAHAAGSLPSRPTPRRPLRRGRIRRKST